MIDIMSLSALSVFVAVAISDIALSLPNPVDAHGWALRTRGQTLRGPYLVGEEPDWHRFEIHLFNSSSTTRKYPALFDAWRHGELKIEITRTDDEVVGSNFHAIGPRAGDLPAYLKSGERESAKFTLKEFGFGQFRAAGVYQAIVVLKTPQGTIGSPTWNYVVVDIPEKDVLASYTVPLAGFRANASPERQERITVQQVAVGARIFLVYRKFVSPKNGGGVNSTFRICEIPARVEMTVDGEYGDRKTPITIKYKDRNSLTGMTTHVISSVDGRTWDDGSSRIAPAPRLVKR